VSSPHQGFLLVRAGARRVGLDLRHVVGVSPLESFYQVPVLEQAIRGITAVQGSMVPVIHLGALLEGTACPPSSTGQGVLVSIEGRRLCLEVDDAELLVRDRVLSMAAGTNFPWACGVARHAGGLVPLLDLFALSSRFLEADPT
jgi:chemotaxis signal transduction protein